MSLPSYLANIKSSGFYRFVWDKSAVSPAQAETMRILIGYSEKGPFNTPVYVDNVADFNTTYGNPSKKLERKGIYFHRLAQQALSSGPILALNLKPFDSEQISYININGEDTELATPINVSQKEVKSVYNTNRFWSLDSDQLPTNIKGTKYMYLAATDSKSTSCSVFVRKSKSVSASYNLTLREWYSAASDEIPSYLEDKLNTNLTDYFVDVYVFRGKFTPELCGPASADGSTPAGVLNPYFKVFDAEGSEIANYPEGGYEEGTVVALRDDYTDIFEEESDALQALADDENSNFLYKYQGCTIPYFKDAMGYYLSVDILLNKDNYDHKLLMKLDESMLDDADSATVDQYLICKEVTDGKQSPIYLEGYDYKALDGSKTSATEYVDKIISVIETESGIRTALTNNVDVEYHYLIDTFNSYSDSKSILSKSKLALLTKEKDNAFAILNFPAINSFITDGNSTYLKNGKFDMSLVASKYTLPSESQGASWCAFFTQVTFSDGTVKSYVPSAALVSNNFMSKWGARQPYYIVAGPTYGVIDYSGMTGPDYNYGRSDLDILEPMGVNAIIYVPRKGTFINSNQTAKQKPVSALSKIHVRELVIYLQDEIENMLQNYQWELNTQTLRDTIKQKADYILENIQNNGGIYAYNSVCDETNNTSEVIDNEMVVLDLEIEPARGAGKMVQTLTIHKTGAISSQG